jgi:hypothetical protein
MEGRACILFVDETLLLEEETSKVSLVNLLDLIECEVKLGCLGE